MISLAEQMNRTGGRSSGFDYLRIGLAALVVVSHLVATTYGEAADKALYASAWGPPLRAILPMFFALSGFLVAGSLERCRSLISFLDLRFIRIVPALAVEVFLSALVLGPLLTHSPLSEYFSGGDFRTYFLNIVGEIHYHLPGLFPETPWPRIVNSQLWTIPFELVCYALISVMALLGAKRWRIVSLLAAGGTTMAYVAVHAIRHHGEVLSLAQSFGNIMVWAYLWGVALFFYRDKISWSPVLFGAAVIASAVCLSLEGVLSYVAPATLAYATVYLGLTDFRRLGFVKHADYSYGAYLYHWVVMQTVMMFAPRQWYINAAISIPLTVAFAALSWHVVEKRGLALRRPIMAADAGTKSFKGTAVSALLAVAVIVAVTYRIAA